MMELAFRAVAAGLMPRDMDVNWKFYGELP